MLEKASPSPNGGNNPENRNENDRWRPALIALLFLLFSFSCLFCSSQSALYFIDREKILGDMRSQLQADYGVDPPLVFPALDPKIVTEIISDQLAETPEGPVESAGIPSLPEAPLVTPFPTVVPPIPTLTPSPTPSATLEPTPPPTATTPPEPATPAPTTPAPVATTPSVVATTPSVVATTPSVVATTPSVVATTPSVVATTPSVVATTPSVVATTPSVVATTPAPPDESPEAVNDTITIPEDSPPITVNVLANDDPNGETDLSVRIISVDGPAAGEAQVNPGGSITYTPPRNFTGTVTIVYEICDDDNDCDTATLTIIITPLPDPPIARNDPSVITSEGVATTTEVMANDSDPDGDPIRVVSVTKPDNGAVKINKPEYTVTYTPTTNFSGIDVFAYTISDPGGLTDTARVTVTVLATNDPPIAQPDAITTAEDSSEQILVLANDTDPDLPDDTLDIVAVSQPLHGTAVISGTVIIYTPVEDYAGPDEFTYTISDSQGATDTAQVTVTIIPVNDPPIARNNVYTTSLAAPPLDVSVPGVLENDEDPENQPLTAAQETSPSAGNLIFNSDGSFTYEPAATGTFRFRYRAIDVAAATDVATVTLRITP